MSINADSRKLVGWQPHLFHELDRRALEQVWPSVAEFLERDEARIGLAQDTVPIAEYCWL
jgi:hypothetical protein